MNAFEKVIGYETVKNELMQICDMVHNKERYEALGARMPIGVLLHGEPGLGKTLLAKCFIEECNINTYTLRNNRGAEKFIDEITDTFEKAKKNAPAIVFLDDMDKFANEDNLHCDANEYVAVQAGIDDVKGYDVLVIATTNNIDKLPDSLIRSGRFDRTIVMLPPSKKDASKIIEHYLENKKLSSNVNFDDLCKMMSYHSCADLETILNEAAIYAGYNKKDAVDMQDLINAVLRLQYNSPDDLMKKDKDEVRKIAIHEAGHLVVSEVIMPGSIGLASVRTKGRSQTGGFIHRCGEPNKRPHEIMSLLGGKVATEMYYSESCASGCYSDLSRAINSLRDDITENGTNGVAFLEYGNLRYRLSDKNNDIREAVVHSELERFIFETRNILIQNRAFLEKIADALVEKETLLYSDIKSIRESVEIKLCVA